MGKGLVGAVIIFAIIVVVMIIILNNVSPIIDEGKKAQAITDAKQTLKTIDNVVNQLAIESTGAKRTIDIDLSSGRFIFSGKQGSMKIRLDDTNLLKPGTVIQDENIVMSGGGGMNSYEADILNDGQQDVVMENSLVLLAVKKLGTSANPVFINTSNIVTQIRNKRQNINMTPNSAKTGIFVNDISNSSFGTGYTELSSMNSIDRNSIVVHMASYANISYDAVFTMASGLDYIEMEVKNVKK
ncbi:hypothetical protein HYZ41_00840 [archaeon]|nr:hypothetical protein [archaeon]